MQGTYGNGRLVTVFGGSGFVGRHVVRALAMHGYRVRVAVRRPDLAGFLRPLGMVGQVQPMQANLRFPQSLVAAVDGAVAVINAAGIHYESGRQSFEAVHATGAAAVAEAAKAAGVARLVHISALGATEDAESEYGRSKAQGDAAIAAIFPQASIIRPSVQFGVGDRFFNRFAAMARLSPCVPVISSARLQPVFVGDVAAAVQRAVDGDVAEGRIYELGGPEVLTFRQCMEEMLAVIDRRRGLVRVPYPFARLMGTFLQFVPGRPLTADQVRHLHHDNIVSDAAAADGRTLAAFGLHPVAMEAILPSYLTRFRVRGQFSHPHNA